jgi:prevent-host-death family protein
MLMTMATLEQAMTKVSKAQIKAKLLEYFRRVEETGEELIVTDRNHPVLRIVPYKARRTAQEAFGDLRGKARLREAAVLAPTTADWEDA